MKRVVIAGLAFMLLLSSLSFGAGKITTVQRQDIPGFVGYVQNEFIVILTEVGTLLSASV